MTSNRPALAATVGTALALGGCFAGPPTVPPSSSPSAQATPAGTPMPASPTPSAPQAGEPTAAPAMATPTPLVVNSAVPASAPPPPSASAPPGSGKKAIVSGVVYDDGGARVSEATVTVKSLDASVPYAATTTTADGTWIVNDVPEGANVEIVATKAGYTRRRRVTSIQTQPKTKNVIDFGAAGATSGDPARSYFISDRPEIEMTTPRGDANPVDAKQVAFTLRVSEPLGPTSRERLARALRLWPANKVAAGRASDAVGVVDYVALADRDPGDGTGAVSLAAVTGHSAVDGFGYAIRQGSTFWGEPGSAATATWNEAGTELTFSFAAPLIASKSEAARYQLGLVSGGAGERIVDDGGLQLGTAGPEADMATYPAAGVLIGNAFREIDLEVGAADTAARRWLATHDSVAGISVKQDLEAPTLVGVGVEDDVAGHTRVELRFTEPMVAFDGRPTGFASAALFGGRTGAPDGLTAYNGVPALAWVTTPSQPIQTHVGGTLSEDLLANFAFALGTGAGETQAVALDGGTATVVDPTSVASFDLATLARKPIRLARESLSFATGVATSVTDPRVAGARPGTVFLTIDERDAAKLHLWILKRPGFFPAAAKEVKAFALGLADPAGNAIGRNLAAANVVYAAR